MRRFIWPVLSLALAASVQGNFPGYLEIMGARPDLVLVVLIAFALAEDPVFGAALGFIAGLIHGSSVGQSMGSFIVTRTTTGFLAGLITSRLFGENPIVTVLSTGALTIVCEIIFLLVNPRPLLYIAVQTIIGETIYNIIFALLFYIFLRYITTRRKIRLANARI